MATTEYYKEWRRNNPAKAKALAKRYRNSPKGKVANRRGMRKALGCEPITDEEILGLFEKQHKKCAICRKNLIWPNRDAHVDHDHKTSKVRGILCSRCNRAIGAFEDNPVFLRAAAKYLVCPTAKCA